VYRATPALYGSDTDPQGFAWIIGDDQQNSVFAFLRKHGDACVLVVSNMTPVPRSDYRIGVPVAGRWVELINTDADLYGGVNMGNGGAAATSDDPMHGHDQSLTLVLPPLATLILAPEGFQS